MRTALSAIFLVMGMTALAALPRSSPDQTAETVDPFYLNLLDEARSLYLRGNAAGAAESLTIACFGLLDSPIRLLEGYVYLALCHHQLKDDDRARFYVLEIRRLKLDERLAGSGLPEDVAARFADLSAKFGKGQLYSP